MTPPSPRAPRQPTPVVGIQRLPARKLPNLTAARALRALEVLVFHPASAASVAAAMGIHNRTARRLIYSLEAEGYLQRGHGTYHPTAARDSIPIGPFRPTASYTKPRDVTAGQSRLCGAPSCWARRRRASAPM
jgi:hypothetical protein